MSQNKRCRSMYTLQGTQPYVLTSNWPKGFTPNKTEYIHDYSLQNIQASNSTQKYHSVNFGNCLIDNQQKKKFYFRT